MKTAKKFGDKIEITFSFNTSTLNEVKSLPGRVYNPKRRVWLCPLKIDIIKKLLELGFTCDIELTKLIENVSKKIDLTPIEINGLGGILRPFQEIGVSFIEQLNGNCIIGDEMGLGKTIQALAWLQLHYDYRPVLIVCTSTAKVNWKIEIDKWISNNKTIEILSGETPYKPSAEILIINYDILPFWKKVLIKYQIKVVIADECHYFKNSAARRSKAMMSICKNIPYKILLSGTPIEIRPIEIYNAWHLVDPVGSPTFYEFKMRYCDPQFNGFGWSFNGSSNEEELHKLLSQVMIRRLKHDVLKELPEKQTIYLPVELDNAKEYYLAENEFISYIRAKKGQIATIKAMKAESMVQIEALKTVAVHGKINFIIDWINEFLKVENKLVIFCVHKFAIDILMEKFKDIAVKIDGSTPTNKRQTKVDRFQNNKNTRLFIGSDAAAESITLTAANTVLHIEFNWTPGRMDQKTDRVHRITQTNQVNVYYAFAVGTIEEKIAKILDQRRKTINNILIGQSLTQDMLLTTLINEYLND